MDDFTKRRIELIDRQIKHCEDGIKIIDAYLWCVFGSLIGFLLLLALFALGIIGPMCLTE